VKVVVILALLLSACSTVSLPSYGVIPEFTLVDQSGREFHSDERLKGKVWVANFIFTNCAGPCPRMSSQMRNLRDSAKDLDVRLVSFTIDPARDTPAVLASYGKRYGADPDRWSFLTGSQADLHKLSRQAFMLGDVDGTLEHSTRFVLLDKHSSIRGFYDSSDPEKMAALIKDMRALAR
jgi:cytochrome oxidase Cu insertion factor (SCO1/SenC/PrrC family)